jgi:hypothetical protein
MPKLAQYQKDALDVLRARLNVLDPGFRGSHVVREGLTNAGTYIDSYVLPLLDLLEHGPATWGSVMLHGLQGDAEFVRHARRRKSLPAQELK